MSLPVIGTKIPNFSLLNQSGNPVVLDEFLGKWILVYFYPKALTPGCTTQACGLRDVQSELQARNVVTLGVSPDPVAKLKKFYDSQGLNFDLLSDPDHKIAERFGVWALKKFMGREFMGVVRNSFIINPKGELAAVLDDFKTANHHEKVLELLKKLA